MDIGTRGAKKCSHMATLFKISINSRKTWRKSSNQSNTTWLTRPFPFYRTYFLCIIYDEFVSDIHQRFKLVRNSASPSSKEISSSHDELSLSPTLSQSTTSISPIVYESFTISPSDVTWSDSYTGTVHGSASPSSKEPSFSPYGLLSSPPTILHTIPSEDPDFLRSIPFSDLIITISFSTTHRILMLDDIKDEPLLI